MHVCHDYIEQEKVGLEAKFGCYCNRRLQLGVGSIMTKNMDS